jgi:hypothetical protein
MKLRLTGAVALGCLFVSFAAPVAESDPSRSAPMQFTLRQDAVNCDPNCKVWISATGMIRADTARDFEVFAAKNNLRGSTVVLNSEGGSVHGAIALGRSIRKLDMTTTVGRTVDTKGASDPRIASIVPKADCESMCAFVLLAGAKRIVPPEARVRVHQIWLGDRRDDAAAANYSAEDLVLVQRDIGKLAQYTIEMGGSVELLEVSLRIPPWEPMRLLSREEMRRMNLDNSDVTDARASQPQSTTSASPSQLPVKRISLTAQAERGWFTAERAGVTTLARKHPLTVEGEDLGTIDLAFACGRNAGEYVVLYSETRRGTGVDAAPLTSVALRLANTVVPMSLEVPRAARDGGEAQSLASGTVTGSMLQNFASSRMRSIVIETTSGTSDPAVIRIGNSGAAAAVTPFMASCAQHPTRAEHAVLQAGSR